MKQFRIFVAAVAVLVSTLPLGQAAAQPPRAEVIVLSNNEPHVTVIDGQTHQVLRTARIPMKDWTWAWLDANNYYDGKHLWLGRRNVGARLVEILLLDLDSLEVTRRIPLGEDTQSGNPGGGPGVFLGKPSRTGKVFATKHESRELVVIDTKTFAVQIARLPIPDGGLACDIDLAVGIDGRERVIVPTNGGNAVLSIDPHTLQVIQTYRVPEGTRPYMVTAAADGRIWIQEARGTSLLILNALTMEMVERVPLDFTPIMGTFSPDGKLVYTGPRTAPFVVAHDTQMFKEVWRTRVGSKDFNAGAPLFLTQKVAVHPSGGFVYGVTDEQAIVVLEAATGKIVQRIALGGIPYAIFVRRLP